MGDLQQMFLPVLSLGLGLSAVVMRMTRSSMLEVLGQDFIRVARAKGLATRTVLLRHALRNALIPIVTVLGFQMGFLLGGVVITEQIFGLPGLGWTLLNGVYQRDYPVVQGTVMVFAVTFVLVNLFVDLPTRTSTPASAMSDAGAAPAVAPPCRARPRPGAPRGPDGCAR